MNIMNNLNTATLSDSTPCLNSDYSVASPHLEEWRKSGIPDSLTLLNVRSLKGDEAKEHLLYASLDQIQGKSPQSSQYATKDVQELFKKYQHLDAGGWWVSSLDLSTGKERPWGQFKPDEPRPGEKGKPIKYEVPPATPTEVIALEIPEDLQYKIATRYGKAKSLAMSETHFWQWAINEGIPIFLTEGAKKAAALIACGYLAIALPSPYSGFQKKPDPLPENYEPELKPDLAMLAAGGAEIYLVTDRDKKSTEMKVLPQWGKLGTAFEKLNNPVHVITGWDAKLGKGIDDILAKNGESWVNKIMEENKISLSQFRDYLESQFSKKSSNDDDEPKIPQADILGKELAEKYRDKLVYNNDNHQWFRYEAELPGVWSAETDEYVESIVSGMVDSVGIEGYGSHSYVVNILKKMRSLLIIRKWQERSPSELLPFENGVLEVKTGKFLEHAPGYRFTWALPRKHDPLAKDFPQIQQFLDQVTKGDPQLINILKCFCNAVLKGRSDLQKFLHLIGPGGTGKGSLMRLIVSLIGKENTHSTTLGDFSENRFESANCYKKRLILFPDEVKTVGNLGKFKSLTGEDYIRGEEKQKKAFQFRYDGMVILSSNQPIFVGDSSSAMGRRAITMPFNFIPSKRKNLESEWESELSAFTNYLLSLSDDFVTKTLLEDTSPVINLADWENQIRIDSIAAWLNDCLIPDAMGYASIGNDRKNTDTLFGSYCDYCEKNGLQAKSSKNFSPDLLELANQKLGWGLELFRQNTGRIVRGLRIRRPEDTDATWDALLSLAIVENPVESPPVAIAVESPVEVIPESIPEKIAVEEPTPTQLQIIPDPPVQSPPVAITTENQEKEPIETSPNYWVPFNGQSLSEGDTVWEETRGECRVLMATPRTLKVETVSDQVKIDLSGNPSKITHLWNPPF